ncbi:MAG: hypothetical protein H6653_16115 [Ardenticatenaceae bacterium]|nr:hypothetical protein [Ardenticatenaceae bacterium]
MRKFGVFASVFLILFIVVSCQQDESSVQQVAVSQELDIVTVTITVSVTPTSTPSRTPTDIPSPSATATVSPTPSPIPTATSKPTAVPTLPPATPETQPSTYQLKNWTEQDALDLINEIRAQIEHFVWDDDVHYSVNNDRFEALHGSLDVASSEAALRFPNSEKYEELVWTSLYAKARRWDNENGAVNALIIAFLQDRLDGGFYDPNEWGERVEIYDFVILHVADVENLFGNGRSIPVYKIETDISDGDDGLYFALESDEANYQIKSVLGYWPASHGRVGEPIIGDHTGDGLPEIAIMPRSHSGSICYSSLYVLQWDGTQFVNLVARSDGSTIGLGVCGDTWRFLPVEENGSQSIRTEEFFVVGNTPTTLNQVFVWDQTKYTIEEVIIQPVSDSDSLEWIDYNVAIGEWETAVQATDELLNRWGTNPPGSVYPSYPDFLRFQQGWLYAVNSQVGNGRAALQQLIDEPVNPITPTLSLAAQEFLNVYQADSDLYQACNAAKETMIDAFPEPSNYSADYLAAWGYSSSGFPCDSSEAWQILLEQTRLMESEEAISFLQAHGVSIVDITFFDLDGDGNDETLFTIESVATFWGVSRSTYAFFETEIGLTHVPLGFDAMSVTQWETALVQDNNALLHFVLNDKMLLVFTVDIQENEVTVQQYFRTESFYNAENFALVEQGDSIILTVDSLPATYRPRQISFRWNPQIEDFETVTTDTPYFFGRSIYDLVAQAKEMLFEEQRIEETAVMLSYYIANYEVEFPEAYYLLALAYELSGQEQEAVETYWQLWRDFPEDSFAIMARRKLMPAG